MNRVIIAVVTLLSSGCESVTGDPTVLLGVSPSSWPEGDRPPLTITGRGFHQQVRTSVKGEGVALRDAFSGTLGGQSLTGLDRKDSETLSAMAPNLPIGRHELCITTPAGTEACLRDAVAVLERGPVEWQEVSATIPTTVDLHDVANYANSFVDVVVVGEEGTVLSWDGTDWTDLEFPESELLRTAHIDDSNSNLYVGGTGGHAWNYSGGWWYQSSASLGAEVHGSWACG